MKTIKVNLKQDPYNIVIGHKILPKIGSAVKALNIGKDALVITNPSIRRLHGKTLEQSLRRSGFSIKVFEVPDGEKSKSAKVAMQLMEEIARYDIFRKVFVIAFGGGVIGDLAGFVAATYKRGVPYVQVPTTFLAQIDSAIGGKVAIDLPVGKNLVGAFYQPKIVYSDVAVLETLPERQVRNGMAEAIKYGVIYDRRFFEYLEKHYQDIFAFDEEVVTHVVYQCSRIKKEVVVADEKETKSIRTILNFGHTVGHAIEAAGGFKLYQHGEAIALGMRIAADISLQKKMINAKAVGRLNDLLSNVGLPKAIRILKQAAILHLMRHDKKFISGKNRFVLATRIGQVKVVEGIRQDMIKKAIQRYKVST
ncbi:MAG: 3-dehydroquinate synthase [Candidatus Omnitrophica bacterium]|nr:3-dehydroquinate synthase [Candidatus Omnitrophota bacterium]